MSHVAGSLAILAALGAALALAGQGGGGAGSPSGDRTLDPVLSGAADRTRAAVARAGVNPERDLLAPLTSLTVSLEPSCPPPAVLACRPAVRVIGQLDGEPPPGYERDLETAIVAGLRAVGFRDITVRASDRFPLAGRVTSRGEVLARWRLEGDALEVTTAGLPLDEPSAPERD